MTTIVILDDSAADLELTRMVVTEVLPEAGVVGMQTPMAVLDFADQTVVDLVIADWRLVGDTAESVTQALHDRGIPVAVLTGFAAQDIGPEAFPAGAKVLLKKPLEEAELCALAKMLHLDAT